MEFLDRLALEELRVLEKEILCPVHLNSPKKYSVISIKILLDFQTCCSIYIRYCSMAIRVVEFSIEGYKISKVFAKESTYPKESIEFLVF